MRIVALLSRYNRKLQSVRTRNLLPCQMSSGSQSFVDATPESHARTLDPPFDEHGQNERADARQQEKQPAQRYLGVVVQPDKYLEVREIETKAQDTDGVDVRWTHSSGQEEGSI